MLTVTMPVNSHVQHLQEAVNNVLNLREQEEFIDIINTYHSQRDVQDLTWSLSGLLDTPAKQQLISHIRKILPKSDAKAFEQLIASQLETLALSKKGHHHTLSHRNTSKNGSTVSMPARLYQTVPTRGAKVLRRPVSQTDFTSPFSRTDLPNWEAGTGIITPHANIKKIYMEQAGSVNAGLGFSIRGGLEHGIGVYVSYVDIDSVAERQGLVPGDQIISVNGISFSKISHEEAAKVR